MAAIIVRDIMRDSQAAYLSGGAEKAARSRWNEFAGVDIGALVAGEFANATPAQIQAYKGPALGGLVKGVVAAYNSHRVMRVRNPVSDSNFGAAYNHSANAMDWVYGKWVRPGEVDPMPSPTRIPYGVAP